MARRGRTSAGPNGAVGPAFVCAGSPAGAGVQRLLLAVLGGLAVALAFPTTSLWGLAPVGLALIGLATCGAGWARGGTSGPYALGLAIFLPTLS